MGTPEIKINVGDLDAGGKHFTFPLRAAWIRGVLEEHEATAAGADGELDVRASRSGNDVVVHGTLTADLTVPCARCLTPVPLPIAQPLSLLFVPGKVIAPPVAPKAQAEKREPKKKRRADLEEYEISAEDADTLPYDGEIILLDDIVRDELILETPIFPLCSEDCPGMSAPPGDANDAGRSTSLDTKHSRSNGEATGEASAETHADIDPRLLPLLRLKNKRD
jgi:uncharacterized protein